MRIAQVAPLYEAVPPTLYGGTERVIAALCDELVARGHDVVLYAAGESSCRAEVRPCTAQSLRTWMGRQELIDVSPHLHLRMLSDVYRDDGVDVVHAHTDVWTLPFAVASPVPTVITLHGRLDIPMVRQVLPMYPMVPLVSISDHQRRAVSDLDLHWVATVPHGLDLRRYVEQGRSAERGQHLVFIGRASIEKRLDYAIDVARRTGHELRIAAKVDPLDVEYFEQTVEPLLGDDTTFVGEIGEPQKPAFFAGAAATLFPSDWPEPFGLVMIESMAAGTPVIALRRGSVPEVLVDGVTGFVCDDVDGMVRAVHRLGEIDPEACRRRARDFTPQVMCERYEEVYRSLAASRLASIVG